MQLLPFCNFTASENDSDRELGSGWGSTSLRSSAHLGDHRHVDETTFRKTRRPRKRAKARKTRTRDERVLSTAFGTESRTLDRRRTLRGVGLWNLEASQSDERR